MYKCILHIIYICINTIYHIEVNDLSSLRVMSQSEQPAFLNLP